jgi:hypothetical protein
MDSKGKLKMEAGDPERIVGLRFELRVAAAA